MNKIDDRRREIEAVSTPLEQNAATLAQETAWLAKVINHRLQVHFPADSTENVQPKELRWYEVALNRTATPKTVNGAISTTGIANAIHDVLPPPDLVDDTSVYAEFVKYYKLSPSERVILMLAIIPDIQPHILDVFFSINKSLGRGYTEFGGIRGTRHSGFLPTIETALFVLAGNDLAARFTALQYFQPDHVFFSHTILSISATSGEPYSSAAIGVAEEYVDFFTSGSIRKPQFSTEFPAKRITSGMNWSDLVVDDFTAGQLDELRIWLQHGPTLTNEWKMGKKLKAGYKVLFYGPPGTGKTLTAALLGKLFGLDVYRIDLSMVISKFIGETEKNLEKVFQKAEHKNWILFFDEADALFAKRTTISDSHDKYANQEVAYLLQRLEDYPGLVILASNMRNNVDEAFTRRLQAIIHFPKPQPKERLHIWNNAFSPVCEPPPKHELERVAAQYELSGGSIMNVVQFASLMALDRGETRITTEDLVQGIKKEYRKEGKT